MVGGIAINLFDFQEKAVLKLIDLVADSNSKQENDSFHFY